MRIVFGLYWWSDGAMVLGKLPVPGRPRIWMIVGQGLTALAVGAGGGCLDIFSPVYHFSFPTLSLWETARYRLSERAVKPKSTNQPTNRSLLQRCTSYNELLSATDQRTLLCKLIGVFIFPNAIL